MQTKGFRLPSTEPLTADPPHAVRRPVMLQGWRDLTAVHWRYDPAEVQALLPSGFRVDTFDGWAWVGLIPFHMRRIRLPGLAPLGPLSSFPETNIRTYIVDAAGRRGVWFMSLDVTRLLPALVARVSYRLPYCWAQMSIRAEAGDASGAGGPGGEAGAVRHYHSRRRWPRGEATSRLSVRIGARIPPAQLSELDHFLSARWALGTTFARRLVWAEVHHEPWALHAAEVLQCDESLVLAAGLSAPEGEPVVRWSPGVEVRIGLPHVIRGSVRR